MNTAHARKGPEDGARTAPQPIVALDHPSAGEAFAVVRRLGPAATFYKVGLELLTAEGPAAVRALVAEGKRVFLDLKLHEIPHSVASAVAVAGRLGVSMVTVHASAGSAVLRAAVQAARPFPQLDVIGLTVITSLRDADLAELGIATPVAAQVLRLAALAAEAGCQGVVASAQEAALLRERLPAGMHIVTPGTYLPGDAGTDQARVTTPADAARLGATHLVVGRSVTRAADPGAAFAEVLRQLGHDWHVRQRCWRDGVAHS